MSKVTLLTTTFYTDTRDIRFHLACQMIGNAVGVGHRVVIVDGSQDPAISQAFVKIGASVCKQVSYGMGGSRRELFMWGNDFNSDFFVWLEPEKVDLIRWVPSIVVPLEKRVADIVVPERTEISWNSYPVPQAESEKMANEVFREATENSFDMMFGPVAFSRGTMSIFMECNPKDQFGVPDGYIQQTAVMVAVAKGFKTLSVPIDFFYPSVQRHEEETMLREVMVTKRKSQFENLTHSFRVVSEALKLKGVRHA